MIETDEQIDCIKTLIDIEEIFETCKHETKKVLVFGRAGIGKSTFCRYIADRWAIADLWLEYELVILIQLRKLTATRYPPDHDYSLVDLVKNEYLHSQPLSEEEESMLCTSDNISKVLWLR
ncbi:unnamed protein product [Rotaria socialis]|uniref:NACHT domain-containing protein n=1 Tax=Rotaria socialis TaxID=392032 RepID=A0A821RV60_9BILA|nr:unnamed protein product [Rotaria socialis]CAF4847516.1 unnamed protein product [Rotaria socialis]